MTLTGATMTLVNLIENRLLWFSPRGTPRWLFMPLWKSRGLLTEGRNRRLLRRFIRQWAKSGIQSQDFFYDYDHQREDRAGQMIVVTVEWKQEFDRSSRS